jgi:hypothetical protein
VVLQILGVVLVVALVFTLFIRPGAIIAIALAFGVVAAAVVVSWKDVEQTRAQHSAQAASVQQNASAQPNTAVPHRTPAHAGT